MEKKYSIHVPHIQTLKWKCRPPEFGDVPKIPTSTPTPTKNKYKLFQSGDLVLVYNNHTKLNSPGTVKDVKSNNSYIVFVDGIDRHISGDNMRLIKDNVKDTVCNLSPNNDLNSDLPDPNVNDSDNDDTISIDSEESDSVYTPTNNVLYNAPRRRYRSEAQKLRDGLSQANPPSRLRSGRQN